MALTRIKTNQITDSAVTTAKIANNAITAGKLANNLTYSSDLTVSGNLTVSGTTIAVTSDNTRITDAIITLAEGGNGSVDAGLVVDRGGSANKAFLWDETASEFVLVDVGSFDGDVDDAATNVTISSYADLQVGTINAATVEIGGSAVTSTAAELNLVDGSSAGTIVNSKAVIYGASGEVNATTLQIGGSSITATAAELNIMDGGTSVGTTAVAGGDGIVTNDSGTMQQTSVDTFDTYLAATTKTLTNKTINSDSNTLTLDLSEGTLTGTTAEFNTALSDDSFATLTNTVTLTNKTLTAPTITSPTVTSLALTDSSIVFEGSTDDANELTLTVADPAADVTVTIQAATDTLVGRATTDTLTNKTINSSGNTLTLNLSEGTLTGTTAEFNSALSDDSFATLTNSVTLTNKTLTTPTINAGMDIKNGATSAGFVKFFEDSDNGSNAVTLIGPASTADVTLTLPAATDTLVGKATTDTFTNKTIDSASNTLTLDLSEGTLTGTTAEFNTALSDDSFATLTNTVTLTNKTLTAPKIADSGFIADANGNELIIFTTTTSAVNEITYANAAASGDPTISTTGDDTNIDLLISPKGTGVINVPASYKDRAGFGTDSLVTKEYVDDSASAISTLTIAADTGTSDTVNLDGGTLNIVGTANEIVTSRTVGDTITVGLATDVTIAGNLTVSGTTTTVNSTTTELEDPVMRLGTSGLSSDGGKDRGIEFLYYDGSVQTGFFGWDNSADAFVLLTGATNSSEVFSGTAGAAIFGAITGSTITSTGTATLNDVAIGGGYGSTGVTISAAGVIQANGAITSDGAVTGGSLTDGAFSVSSGAVTGVTTITTSGTASLNDATVGGGYGSTGVTISAAGVIQANGAITSDGTITGGTLTDGAFSVSSGAVTGVTTISTSGTATINDLTVGGGYGSTGVTISAAGNIQANGTLTVDGTSTLATVDINAGAIDGTTIGANSAAAGTFTTINASGTITGDVTGNVTGNADTATEATNVTATANNSTNETTFITFVDGATGTQGIETDTGLTYNPSTGVLTTTSVTGNLTGDVTGNADTATTATEATNVTATANNTTDETVYITFVDGATGTQGIETDTGLNYNPSSGVLTTTSVTGNLTGNVTGNVTGDVTATNVQVTNIKANDGTASASIADSTGIMTITSSVLTSTDINGGSIDGATIGAASASSGAFTTISASGAITASSNVDIADAGSLRVGTGNDFTINHDGTNTTITNGTGILAIDGLATSSIRVNEAGANVDFVVEGDTNTALLTVDASGDNVGIGGAPNANAVFHINDTGAMILATGTTAQRPTGVTGMLRFNSTIGGVEYYDGSSWASISSDFTVATSQTFNGDNSTTAFTLSALTGADSYTVAGVLVMLNGVVQEPTTVYGISGTTLTFTTAPASGDLIEVRKFTTTTTVTALADLDGDTQIQLEESSDEDVIRFDTAGTERVTINASGLNIVSGTMNGTATSAQYADLAEMYAADAEIEPGTVVMFAGECKVAACDADASRAVAGIISTDPAHLMNSVQEGVALALAGRVPCKVTGPVAAGDLMVSAGNGMARAEANPSIGTVIGKAIEANEDGEGVIEVLALMM